MLHHPTLDTLQTLRLSGRYHALLEQMTMPDIDALSFEERLGFLVDREMTERDSTRRVAKISTIGSRAASTRPS